MGQLTLYLDAETMRQMKDAARAAGVSQSRWVSDVLREKLAGEWPASVTSLAGAWPDMPSLEEIRGDEAEDLPREPFSPVETS